MAILLLHLVSTLFMTGLIWFVQVVHYPIARLVGTESFGAYQRAHMQRTSWVVGPPMLLEAGSTLWLLFTPPVHAAPWLPVLGAALLGVVWLSTLLQQIPAHDALLAGYDAHHHRRLVGTNWVRTIGWTLRAGIATAMVFYAAG